jgi:hypothetical protein
MTETTMTVLIVAREPAVLGHIVSLVGKAGIDARSTTNDDDAIAQLEAGGVTSLVIGGGVEEASKQRLRSVAARTTTDVVQGALRGKDPEIYVRDELLPALRRKT